MKSRAWRRWSSSQTAAYQGGTRYNRAPYRDVAHGRRFLNNYANEKARAYGRFENAGRLGARPQRLHQSVMIGPLFPRIGSVFGSAVPAMLALVA